MWDVVSEIVCCEFMLYFFVAKLWDFKFTRGTKSDDWWEFFDSIASVLFGAHRIFDARAYGTTSVFSVRAFPLVNLKYFILITHFIFSRIRHFAGTVTYSIKGFIDKNNDKFPKHVSFGLYQSKLNLVQILFPEGKSHLPQLHIPNRSNNFSFIRKSKKSFEKTNKY
jgi:hypothetical protein